MIISANDFNLEATLESGQVFGFVRRESGVYEGCIQNRRVCFAKENGTLQVESSSGISEQEIRHYFDLDQNLSAVYEILSHEPSLAQALEHFRGLRLIRQDPWEALAGFVISANNNVKRIQGIWQRLSRTFCPEGQRFPTAEELSQSNEKSLRELGLGYRAPYLLGSAREISENPEFLKRIASIEYDAAKEILIKLPGVGPKVAECILLYGFHKLEAFPMDVWVLRKMREFYFKGRNVKAKRIEAFSRKRWGALRGYIQQYLFHGARTGLI